MKRMPILFAICAIALTQTTFAQLNPDLISANTGAGRERPKIDPAGPIHSQFLIFNDTDGAGDSGTYNPTDSFGFDIYLTYSGYNSVGFDVWFATTLDLAPHIFLAGFAYAGPFDEPTQPDIPFPVGFTQLQFDGLHYSTPTPSDIGSTRDPHLGGVQPGTYFVGHVSFSLSGLAPGIYILQSSTSGPNAAQVTSYDGTNFADNFLPAATYTITIVPEPSTGALLLIAAIVTSAVGCRRIFAKPPNIGHANSFRRYTMKKIYILCAICGIGLAPIVSAQLNSDFISANVGAGRERPTTSLIISCLSPHTLSLSFRNRARLPY